MNIKNETPLQDERLDAVTGGREPEPGDYQDDRPCPNCGSSPIWVHECGGMGPGGSFTERWCDACGYVWNQ